MARFSLALLLMAAFPAYAQQPMYRCVDQNNRTTFSDKPGPGCKPTHKPAADTSVEQQAAPGKAAAKGAKKDAKKVAKAPAPETPAQRCSRVQGQLSDMKPGDRQKARDQLAAEC
jgi:hypothetical protein